MGEMIWGDDLRIEECSESKSVVRVLLTCFRSTKEPPMLKARRTESSCKMKGSTWVVLRTQYSTKIDITTQIEDKNTEGDY